MTTSKDLWSKTSSCQPVSKKSNPTERLLLLSHTSTAKFPGHSSWTSRPRSSFQPSIPMDKEGRKLDSLGKKSFSSASSNMRIASFQAVMVRNQFQLWEKMALFTRHPPEGQRTTAVIHKGQNVAKYSLRAPFDISDNPLDHWQQQCLCVDMLGYIHLPSHWISGPKLKIYPSEEMTYLVLRLMTHWANGRRFGLQLGLQGYATLQEKNFYPGV